MTTAPEPISTADHIADALLERAERGEEVDAAAETVGLPDDLRRDVLDVLDRSLAVLASLGKEIPLRTASLPTIASYHIRTLLGQGGMAKVYLADHDATHREVALKLLPRSAATQRLEARFRFEQGAARLEHEGIVRVYDAADDSAYLYIAMEYVRGPSLADLVAALRNPLKDPHRGVSSIRAWLAERGVVASSGRAASGHAMVQTRSYVEFCVEVAQRVAMALSFAHESGLIHRDVKPSNVLLALDGSPKLADFGLARGRLDPHLTLTTERPGTIAYMSPQQLDPLQGAVDERADVYGLAATLYEVLTLRRPLEERSESDRWHAVCVEMPIAPHRLNPAIPRDLSAVLMRGLEKAPEDRYASAGAFAADLGAFLQGRLVSACRPAVWTRCVRRLRRDRTMRRHVLVSVVSLFLAVTVGAFVFGQNLWARQQTAGRLESWARDMATEVDRSIGSGDHQSAQALAQRADGFLETACGLAIGEPSRERLLASRLRLARRTNQFAPARAIAQGADLNVGEADLDDPDLLLELARTLAWTSDLDTEGDATLRAVEFASRAARKYRERGSVRSARDASLIAAVLSAFGRIEEISVPGVFDPSALDASATTDVICVGIDRNDRRPVIRLWRSSGQVEELDRLDIEGGSDESNPGLLWVVRQGRGTLTRFAVLGIEDQLHFMTVDSTTSPSTARVLAKVVDLSSDRRKDRVNRDLVVLEWHSSGIPKRMLWLAINDEANPTRLLSFAPDGALVNTVELSSAMTNGHAFFEGSGNGGSSAELALGLGEWTDGFGIAGFDLEGARRYLMRVGHISALCAAPLVGARALVFCRSNRWTSYDYFSATSPWGWDRGVYLGVRDENAVDGWRVERADLSMDPVEFGEFAVFGGVATLECAEVPLCVVISREPSRDQVELRWYELPRVATGVRQLAQAASIGTWDPLLRTTVSPKKGFGGQAWVADLDRDGHPELCSWRRRVEGVSVTAIRMRSTPGAVDDVKLPERLAPPEARGTLPPIPVGSSFCSSDPRMALDGEWIVLDGPNTKRPRAGFMARHEARGFSLEFEFVPRPSDFGTSVHVGISELGGPNRRTYAAEFEVGGTENYVVSTARAKSWDERGEAMSGPQFERAAAQRFTAETPYRVILSYVPASHDTATDGGSVLVEIRDTHRPRLLLSHPFHLDGQPPLSDDVFIGLLPSGATPRLRLARAQAALRLARTIGDLRLLSPEEAGFDRRTGIAQTLLAEQPPNPIVLLRELELNGRPMELESAGRALVERLAAVERGDLVPAIWGRWLTGALPGMGLETVAEEYARARSESAGPATMDWAVRLERALSPEQRAEAEAAALTTRAERIRKGEPAPGENRSEPAARRDPSDATVDAVLRYLDSVGVPRR